MAATAEQTGVEACSMRPLYFDMDGFRLSAAFNIERFRSAVNYKAKEGDIFIATYPKCGTTWLQEICYLIFNDGESPKNHMERLIDTPFFELMGADCVDKMQRPGAIKTHLPFHLIPYSSQAKYIYVTRNPKDCVVSFFYHTSKTYPGYMFSDGTFSEFFDLFMTGKTDFGSYFDNVRSWLRQKDKQNIHFILFEDVKKNGPEEILRLGRFLGEEYEAKLNAGLLEKVLEKASLKKMKEDFQEFVLNKDDQHVPEALRQFAACNAVGGSGEGSVRIRDHVRKGSVNDWKNHLTPEQNDRIEAAILSELNEDFPEIVAKWREHGVFDPLTGQVDSV